jgi:phospholipid/cholesterol/gamma-HCH transport system substrate-binding protein
MATRAPSVGQIAIIAAFSLSCVGILIYLWVTFGGSIPLAPTGYEVKVPFTEATTLAQQSDVRISGVSVGKVKKIELSPDHRHALATLDIDPAYAPLPASTRAILRAKTLLGEAYIELAPGSKSGPKLAEGATLPVAQVAPTVKLDEILRTFDEPTRAAFQTWMQNAAPAINGRGQDLGDAIGELQPTFAAFDDVFRTLDTQQQAVSQLFSNGAVTFDAFQGRQHDLAGLINDADRVFAVTGRRNVELANAFRAFPTFLDESKATVERLRTFSETTDPLIQQLIPVARQLSPTLVQLNRMSPGFRSFFTGLGPTVNRSPRGLGAFRALLTNDFPPVLTALDPFARQLIPVVKTIGAYKQEVTSVFANATAATNGILPGASGQQPHYLRSLAVMSPESLAAIPHRLRSNRNSAYTEPGGYAKLPNLLNFLTAQCSSGAQALLDPTSPTNPAFNAHTGGDVSAAQTFFNRLKLYAFGNTLNSNNTPAPGCGQQSPLAPIGASGAATDFQHVLEQP